MSRFILLDRDGVINRGIAGGYVTSWNQFEFLPGVLDSLKLLTENGYKVVVVSNQAGVGRGLVDPAALEDVTRSFTALVEAHGGRISDVYYCPHRKEDGCACRKPETGLLVKAQTEHGFNFVDTFLVGDSESDLVAAARVGCPALLVAASVAEHALTDQYSARAVVQDLGEAARLILSWRLRA